MLDFPTPTAVAHMSAGSYKVATQSKNCENFIDFLKNFDQLTKLSYLAIRADSLKKEVIYYNIFIIYSGFISSSN